MDRYIYTLFEMGLIIGSAILTNIIVHKKKGYDTYIPTWEKLGRRILYFLVFFMTVIFYIFCLNKTAQKSYAFGYLLLFLIIVLICFFIGLIVIGIIYYFINEKDEKLMFKPVKKFFSKLSECDYDTLCNIAYIFDVIFYFILFFGLSSFIFYFCIYNEFLSVNKPNKDLIIYMNIITTIHYFIIILLIVFWIIDVLFIWFRLRLHFDKDSSGILCIKEHKNKQKEELQFRKIDRDDIKL